jgi:hypothetical protein
MLYEEYNPQAFSYVPSRSEDKKQRIQQRR